MNYDGKRNKNGCFTFIRFQLISSVTTEGVSGSPLNPSNPSPSNNNGFNKTNAQLFWPINHKTPLPVNKMAVKLSDY